MKKRPPVISSKICLWEVFYVQKNTQQTLNLLRIKS